MIIPVIILTVTELSELKILSSNKVYIFPTEFKDTILNVFIFVVNVLYSQYEHDISNHKGV